MTTLNIKPIFNTHILRKTHLTALFQPWINLETFYKVEKWYLENPPNPPPALRASRRSLFLVFFLHFWCLDTCSDSVVHAELSESDFNSRTWHWHGPDDKSFIVDILNSLVFDYTWHKITWHFGSLAKCTRRMLTLLMWQQWQTFHLVHSRVLVLYVSCILQKKQKTKQEKEKCSAESNGNKVTACFLLTLQLPFKFNYVGKPKTFLQERGSAPACRCCHMSIWEAW